MNRFTWWAFTVVTRFPVFEWLIATTAAIFGIDAIWANTVPLALALTLTTCDTALAPQVPIAYATL